jgi:hypothetical protein
MCHPSCVTRSGGSPVMCHVSFVTLSGACPAALIMCHPSCVTRHVSSALVGHPSCVMCHVSPSLVPALRHSSCVTRHVPPALVGHPLCHPLCHPRPRASSITRTKSCASPFDCRCRCTMSVGCCDLCRETRRTECRHCRPSPLCEEVPRQACVCLVYQGAVDCIHSMPSRYPVYAQSVSSLCPVCI